MSEQPEQPAQVSGAQSLIRSLEAAGASNVFGIPGGAILPAYDPLFDSVKLRHILVRHEQGAGHAAQGYAVATGKRSEEHTSELQSRQYLVCRLLLEKKTSQSFTSSLPATPNPTSAQRPKCSAPQHSELY